MCRFELLQGLALRSESTLRLAEGDIGPAGIVTQLYRAQD